MTYKQFKTKCKPGTLVKDGERLGTVIKISQDNEKALVRFGNGLEWIEYYKIELQ